MINMHVVQMYFHLINFYKLRLDIHQMFFFFNFFVYIFLYIITLSLHYHCGKQDCENILPSPSQSHLTFCLQKSHYCVFYHIKGGLISKALQVHKMDKLPVDPRAYK